MSSGSTLSRAKTLFLAVLAGITFAVVLTWLLGALGWLEVGLAQAQNATPGRVSSLYRFIFPLVDAGVCGLLVGLALGLVHIESRWFHVAAFFVAFYIVEMAISGARVFTQLFTVAPFMWLFPIVTCAVILLSQRLKRRAT